MILNLSEIDKVTALALDQETLEQMVQDMAAATVEAPVQEETAPVAASAAAPVREEAIKAAAAKTVAAPSRTIRVDIERLDVLMNLFSELLIDRVRLEQLATEVQNSDLTETVEHMGRVSGDLQNIVMKLRMVPVDTVFNRFPAWFVTLPNLWTKKSI